jgi:hypothetical protein
MAASGESCLRCGHVESSLHDPSRPPPLHRNIKVNIGSGPRVDRGYLRHKTHMPHWGRPRQKRGWTVALWQGQSRQTWN